MSKNSEITWKGVIFVELKCQTRENKAEEIFDALIAKSIPILRRDTKPRFRKLKEKQIG